MPNTSVLQNVCWYLSGYADGEGSFCVSFSPRNKFHSKLEVRPSFSVSQNSDRSEVLRIFKDILGCGTIRPDRSDKTLKFEIRNLDSLVEKVIPFFKRYPLKSSKNLDFILFSQVCLLMKQGKHKNRAGLKKIIILATKMNISGKRKYNIQKLLSIL
jgi:hypothetical protein